MSRFDTPKEERTYPKALESTGALNKWPAFIVWGESVTPEQAEEIILRTHRLWFGSNDPSIEKELFEIMGVSLTDPEEYRAWPKYEDLERAHQEIESLEENLEYLKNNNILSSYAGGPGGWISWDGSVGCRGSNIGKWPCCHNVYDEWCLIAETFPFLDLTCHLYNCESGDISNPRERPHPVIEYRVQGGKVAVKNLPEPYIPEDVKYRGWSIIALQTLRFQSPRSRELGIPIPKFKEIWERVKKKFLHESVPLARFSNLEYE